MCVTDPWAHMSLVHSILSLKLGVTPRGYNPEHFCDHEVIGKALTCVLVQNMGSWSWPTRASLLDPLWADAFNAVGGRCVLIC